MNFSVGSHAMSLQILSPVTIIQSLYGGSVSVLVSPNLKQANRHPGGDCPRTVQFLLAKRTKTSLWHRNLLDIRIYTLDIVDIMTQLG